MDGEKRGKAGFCDHALKKRGGRVADRLVAVLTGFWLGQLFLIFMWRCIDSLAPHGSFTPSGHVAFAPVHKGSVPHPFCRGSREWGEKEVTEGVVPFSFSPNFRISFVCAPGVSALPFGISFNRQLVQGTDATKRRKIESVLSLVIAGVVMVLILLASWVSDSRMTELRWLPGWIARLADRDPNIRTAIPFIPLTFLLAHALARLGLKRALLGASVASAICLGLSEFGQIFIPGRTADKMDLRWGGAGILLGLGAAWGWGRVMEHRTSNT